MPRLPQPRAAATTPDTIAPLARSLSHESDRARVRALLGRLLAAHHAPGTRTIDVARALEHVARAAGFHRAMLLVPRTHGGPAGGWWRSLAAWHAPELPWVAETAADGGLPRVGPAAFRRHAGPVCDAVPALGDPTLRAYCTGLSARRVFVAPTTPDGTGAAGILLLLDCRTDRPRSDEEVALLGLAAECLGERVAPPEEPAQGRDLPGGAADAAGAEAAGRLDHADAGATALLADLGIALGVDRALLFGYEPPGGRATMGWAVLRAEWTSAGIVPLSTPGEAYRLDLAQYAVHWQTIQAERVLIVSNEALAGAARRQQDASGSRSRVVCSIVADRQVLGFLRLDACREARRWQEAELTLLRLVAASLVEPDGAAPLLGAAGRTASPPAASALTRRNALLTTAVRASRALIEAVDLDAVFVSLVAGLGTAFGARSVMLGLRTGLAGDEGASFAVAHAWEAPGTALPADGPRRFHASAGAMAALCAGDTADTTIAWPAPAHDVPPAAEATCAPGALTFPLFVEGALWGALRIDQETPGRPWDRDDLSYVAIIGAAIGAAVQRQQAERTRLDAVVQARAQAAEERAATLATVNAELRQREALLTSAAESLRALLTTSDLEGAIADALRRIGEAAALHRVTVILEHPLPATGASAHHVSHEWCASGYEPHAGPGRTHFDTADLLDLVRESRAGRSLWLTPAALPAAVQARLARTGTCALGVVPVFVGAQYAGVILFDDCTTPRAWSQAEKDALTMAAHAIGAAIYRRDMERMAEHRAARAEALNEMLERLSEATRALLDAADFATGVLEWLGQIASLFGADRAGIGAFVVDPARPSPFPSSQLHWARPGLEPYSVVAYPETVDFVAYVTRLLTGEIVQPDPRTFRDPASTRFWQDVGAADVIVPVRRDQQVWGWFCLDHAPRHAYTADELTILRLAADDLAAALRREDALRVAAHERDVRAREAQAHEVALAVERQRAEAERLAEVLKVNRVLRDTMAALAGQKGVGTFMASLLAEAVRVAGADAGAVVRHAPDGARLEVVERCTLGPDGTALRGEGATGDAARRAETVPAWACVQRAGTLVVVAPGDHGPGAWPLDAAGFPPSRATRHGYLRLQVGERPLGFLAVAWHAAPPALSAEREALLATMAQQLSLALELERLAAAAEHEVAQRAALQERTRIARDMHDTLAQGLAGIVMHLKTMRQKLGHGAAAVLPELARLEALARDNLADARRSIAALRPHAIERDGLAAALRHLAAASAPEASAGGGTAPAPAVTLRIHGAPGRMPADVEMELFRMTEEAVRNARTHARARAVTIDLTFAAPATAGAAALAPHVRVAVADDGIGFDPEATPPHRYGLVGMSERAARIGAVLTLVSAPGEGTEVVVVWRPPAAARGHVPAPASP